MRFEAQVSLCLLAALGVGMPAAAIDCPEPPPTYLRNFGADFQAAALKVRRVSGPGVGGSVKLQAKSLLDRIPNADKVLVETTYLYMLCTALRDDKNLSEERKAKQLSEYMKALRVATAPASTARISAPPAAPRNASAPAASTSQGSTTTITGNSGPVVTGNQVGGNLTVNTPAK